MYREFTQLEEIPDEYQFVEMEFSAINGSLVAQDTKNVTLTSWSPRRELDPRPTHYECVALPLSYPGVTLNSTNQIEFSSADESGVVA